MAFWLYAAPHYQDRPPVEWGFVAYDAALDHVPEQVWLLAFAGDRPVVFRSNDLVSQAAAARAGMGIAALPCFLGHDDPGLVEIAADLPPIQRDINLVVHTDLRRVPAVRVVLDFIADQVACGMPRRRAG